MSRTHKDVPYRIRANKSGHTVHRHYLFGREVTRPVPLVDENGHQLWREAGTYMEEDGWGKLEKHIRYVPAYRRVLKYRYADHCTVGESLPDGYRSGWQSPIPCFPVLPPEEDHSNRFSRSEKFFRRYKQGAVRSDESQKLRKFAKEWNSGEELDDSNAPWMQHRHSIGWWD